MKTMLTIVFASISAIGYSQQSNSTNKTPSQSKTNAQATAPATAPTTVPNSTDPTISSDPTTPDPTTTPDPDPTTPDPVITPDQTTSTVTTNETEINNPTIQDKPILILINEESPDQIIVFDSTGKWLDTIKSIAINIDVGTGSIMATTTLWKGILKPKNPKIQKYRVKELKSVTTEMFNDKLVELNNE